MNMSKQASELIQAQIHVVNHTFNFINSMALKCAIQLNIPDTIHKHGKPMTASELVRALPINKARYDSITRLINLLVHSGFFAKSKVSEGDQEEEGFSLTLSGRLLLKDEPLSHANYVLGMLDQVMTEPWHQLSEWFQNEVPTTFETGHGKPFWEYAANEPRINQLFNQAMTSATGLIATVLTTHCRHIFQGLNSLVDVGGGSGALCGAIAKAFPDMKCTVLDLPHVVAGLEGSQNLNYIGGDMFKFIPPADAILLKSTLHDWSHEAAVKALRRCKEAIPSKEKGGKVIVIDIVLDSQKEDHHLMETKYFFNMLMTSLHDAGDRNEKDWAKLFFDAGFSHYKLTPVLGLTSLMEVYP